MSALSLFVDHTGTTRRPWRLAVFVLATLVAYAILQTAAYAFLGDGVAAPVTVLVVNSWTMLGALLAGHLFTFATVEPRSWGLVRLDRAAARPGAVSLGFLLGVLAIGVPSLALLGVGWLRAVPGAPGSSFAMGAVLLIVLAPAALAEELLVRGYIFALLRDVWGARVTLLVTSIVFGLLHLANVGATPLSLSLVTLAGVYLGAILLATESLYAAWAAHLGWNWALAGLLHTAVSGIPFETPSYRIVDAGPDWATGGIWGPEGGVAAALGMLGGLSYLIVRRKRREER